MKEYYLCTGQKRNLSRVLSQYMGAAQNWACCRRLQYGFDAWREKGLTQESTVHSHIRKKTGNGQLARGKTSRRISRTNLYKQAARFYHAGGTKNQRRALVLLLAATGLGDLAATLMAGQMIYCGEGTRRDRKEAIALFRIAARWRYPGSEYWLGIALCRVRGRRRTSNLVQSLHWFRKGACVGDRECQHELGWMYLRGRGVERNKRKAFHWFKKAATNGDTHSRHSIAIMYLIGDGVARNVAKAFYWYREGALCGNVRSMYELGVCYALGEGTKINMRRAVHWYSRAARQGHRRAQYHLGLRLLRGKGIRRNFNEAVAWLRKARVQGHKGAARVLSHMRTKEGRKLEMSR